ncbi:serine hydrolase [Portibacter marinus]|uniref:serine hydrolase n=1 Tax=Portibacter marinus TaxID=2898660 RepID=UPI001F2C47CD|nr:serine hydrolase [Portibacter marinus]
MKLRTAIIFSFIVLFLIQDVYAYPIDGYWYTGIRRLLDEQNIAQDSNRTSKLEDGALYPMDAIQLFLTDYEYINQLDSFPEENAELQKKVNALFYGLNNNYSISVLDVTEGRPPRYAERRSLVGYQPGSVGKIIVLNALMYELNELFPGDWEKQRALLIEKYITGGDFAVPNSHTVPFWDEKKQRIFKRHPNERDVFTLYEWLDHMVSVSSNAAASILYREAIFMHVFKDEYECMNEWEAIEWLDTFPKDSLGKIAEKVMHGPLRELGISEDEWSLGQPFTRGASRVINPIGGSIGTTKGVMKWLIALEKGEIVNERSSLEMKRLLYITDRRIRYGASHALDDAKLHFKSGSLYSCMDEPGFSCGKYRGNRYNYMNSVAIVEHPDCTRYLVVLMSNVLRKNSAGDHYGLASSIDRLVRDVDTEKDDTNDG